MEEKREIKPEPFFIMLKKKQQTTHYTSYAGEEENYKYKDDGVLKELQTYVNASNEKKYDELVTKLSHRMFRRTKGTVYEMFDEGNEINIRIALQVKGHSLTWYFWKNDVMDQYPQKFRDKLYNAAAQAHKKVINGCDLYYRGSNSVHLKLMHHLEGESTQNHNHYRLKNNQPYTPEDFNQHLNALKETEAFAQFFNDNEIEEIQKKFAEFYTEWHAKPEEGLSRHEAYIQDPSQRLNAGDVIELMLFGYQQEPCRISVHELQVDYDAARNEIETALKLEGSPEALQALKIKLQTIEKQYNDLLSYREKGGSRGLFSQIGSTRQTYKSTLKPISYVAGQDGDLGAPPEIPEWAKKLTALVEEGKKAMIETRADKEAIAESESAEAIKRFEQEIPAHVRLANMQKGTRFFKQEEKNEEVITPSDKKGVQNT